MRILLCGYGGHMGREVRTCAERDADSEIVAGVDPMIPAEGACVPSFNECTAEADVIIDFSHHSMTGALLDFAEAKKLPVVLATTGQTEEEKAEQYVTYSAKKRSDAAQALVQNMTDQYEQYGFPGAFYIKKLGTGELVESEELWKKMCLDCKDAIQQKYDEKLRKLIDEKAKHLPSFAKLFLAFLLFYPFTFT